MKKGLAITAVFIIIMGILLYFLGSISLFEGIVLSHYGNHSRYFGLAYIVNFILEFWGIGLVISGVIVGALASDVFNIKRTGKIILLAVGVAVLVIGASLSSVIVNESFPPPEKMNILELGTSSNFYEENATPPFVSFSVYSLYTANVSISYTYSGRIITAAEGSFVGYLNSSAVPPAVSFTGIMGIALTIQSGGAQESKNSSLTIVPQLQVLNISGPQNINDSTGPVSASYSPVFMGGIAPFNFTWSIGAFYVGNIQNLTNSSPYGRVFNVTFFENPINNYSFGYNVSVDVTLTVTDSLGITSSYQNGSEFFSSYFVVQVVGD